MASSHFAGSVEVAWGLVSLSHRVVARANVMTERLWRLEAATVTEDRSASVHDVRMISWGEFVRTESEMASFGADRLGERPAYLATVRKSGAPRVHPVTPIFTSDGLFLFMEPASPKGRDLRERGRFALHNGVPDNEGSGGEFYMSGRGVAVEDAAVRLTAVQAAGYEPAESYVLFELKVSEARCKGYGDVELPTRRRWP